MAFRFPLATVLRVREHAEQREERALKKIQLEVNHARRQIEELDAVMDRAHAAGLESMQSPIEAFKLQEILRQAAAAQKSKEAVEARLATLVQELARQMQVYQAAHRNREALSTMLEKQRDVYDLEQTRARQKQLDDLFMARRHRSE